MEKYRNLKYFVGFLGYPRSGHTIVAAILNANPNMYCSNQLHILGDFEKYNSNNDLFDYIKNYSVNPGTWKPTTQIPHAPKQEITVIGDKTGHRSALTIGEKPEVVGEFREFTGLPIRWIHVVRNPFDNLSTWGKLEYEVKQRKGIKTTQEKELNIVIEEYDKLNYTIEKLKKSENILTIYHEYVTTRMHNTLEEMCDFLEISFHPEWRDNVRNSVWKKPRITRRQIPWASYQRKTVNAIIARYPWLNGYNYGCGGCR